MGDRSGIEWTDATWNPVLGCSKVSPGCDNCYAISMSARLQGIGNKDYQGLTISGSERLDEGAKTGSDWSGLIRVLPERLDQPLRWTKPRRVFVNSMSDLFHPDVPEDFITEVFAVMAVTRRHQYQVLTKRPQRMATILGRPSFPEFVAEYATELMAGPLHRSVEVNHPEWYATPADDGNLWRPRTWPLPNIWLGTSIESDRYVFRANRLRETQAAVRFLSLEPLLGPLPSLSLERIDWVIVGGESGPGARPMHPDWVRDIRDRCVDAGVPFFFKQWGAWAPHHDGIPYVKESRHRMNLKMVSMQPDGSMYDPRKPDTWRHDNSLWRIGKKAAGRELDGRTWDEYPMEVPA